MTRPWGVFVGMELSFDLKITFFVLTLSIELLKCEALSEKKNKTVHDVFRRWRGQLTRPRLESLNSRRSTESRCTNAVASSYKLPVCFLAPNGFTVRRGVSVRLECPGVSLLYEDGCRA